MLINNNIESTSLNYFSTFKKSLLSFQPSCDLAHYFPIIIVVYTHLFKQYTSAAPTQKRRIFFYPYLALKFTPAIYCSILCKKIFLYSPKFSNF